MKRRNFVKLGSVLACSSLIPLNGFSGERNLQKEQVEKSIDFIYDGTKLSPNEYSQLLLRLLTKEK
jgi:hypothetical protein